MSWRSLFVELRQVDATRKSEVKRRRQRRRASKSYKCSRCVYNVHTFTEFAPCFWYWNVRQWKQPAVCSQFAYNTSNSASRLRLALNHKSPVNISVTQTFVCNFFREYESAALYSFAVRILPQGMAVRVAKLFVYFQPAKCVGSDSRVNLHTPEKRARIKNASFWTHTSKRLLKIKWKLAELDEKTRLNVDRESEDRWSWVFRVLYYIHTYVWKHSNVRRRFSVKTAAPFSRFRRGNFLFCISVFLGFVLFAFLVGWGPFGGPIIRYIYTNI